MTLLLDTKARVLQTSDGQVFNPASRTWRRGAEGRTGDPVSLPRAVAWLQGESGSPSRVPIAIIGPREARDDQLEAAATVGAGLAGLQLTVICGGRQGVMEAACRGVELAGGISVGILPDDSPSAANPYVTIPIATGIGIARNAIIARSALCLVAVGGGYGTISEVALSLQFEKPVFTLLGGPDIPGVRPCDNPEMAIDFVLRVVLGLPPNDEL